MIKKNNETKPKLKKNIEIKHRTEQNEQNQYNHNDKLNKTPELIYRNLKKLFSFQYR